MTDYQPILDRYQDSIEHKERLLEMNEQMLRLKQLAFLKNADVERVDDMINDELEPSESEFELLINFINFLREDGFEVIRESKVYGKEKTILVTSDFEEVLELFKLSSWNKRQ